MEEEQVVEPTEEVAEETEEIEDAQVEEPADDVEDVEDVEEEPPPRKQTAQERINEITRKRREAEREAEYWRKVALEKKSAKEEPAPEAPKLPARPRVDDFETTEQYEDALFEWRDTIRETEGRAEKEKREFETALKSFNDRADELRARHEDFDEVIENPVFSEAMRDVLLQDENGPELAYFLGKPENWKEAERIRELPPLRQAAEMGKLTTKILVAKQTKKVSSAPKPISPVGMSGADANKDPAKMTTEEWMEWDKNREIEKIKARYSGG